MTNREAVVYALRDKSTNKIFYIGSSIRKDQRKYAHSTDNINNSSHLRSYIVGNSIEYSYELIERISGERSELIRKVRRLEQKYILKSKNKLINKNNPLSFISKLNKKYPWLSNKTKLRAIV